MNLVDLVANTHRILDEGDIRHAIGGAIALGYHGRPRATADVDVNVFVPFGEAAGVVERFAPVGFTPERPPDEWIPISGVRLVQPSGRPELNLFFAVNETYVGFVDRSVMVPFGTEGLQIPILCAEDIAMFKISFGRPRDWIDLEDLTRADVAVDLDAIEERLIAVRGPSMYPRLSRFRAMMKVNRPDEEDR